jgi:hypothetical protein
VSVLSLLSGSSSASLSMRYALVAVVMGSIMTTKGVDRADDHDTAAGAC